MFNVADRHAGSSTARTAPREQCVHSTVRGALKISLVPEVVSAPLAIVRRCRVRRGPPHWRNVLHLAQRLEHWTNAGGAYVGGENENVPIGKIGKRRATQLFTRRAKARQ